MLALVWLLMWVWLLPWELVVGREDVGAAGAKLSGGADAAAKGLAAATEPACTPMGVLGVLLLPPLLGPRGRSAWGTAGPSPICVQGEEEAACNPVEMTEHRASVV